MVHGLSCPTARGGLPGPGIKPVSPTVAGRFFTTEPPGKPSICCFEYLMSSYFCHLAHSYQNSMGRKKPKCSQSKREFWHAGNSG